MRTPTTALVWEIWSRNRTAIQAIVVMTTLGLLMPGGRSPAVELLAMLSFVLLFAVFNDAELLSRRLMLPISSLHLVAVPMFAGVTSIELLYLLWAGRMSGGGSPRSPFAAALCATFIVSFQTATWMLAPFGALKLVVIGALSVAFIVFGFLAPDGAAVSAATAGAAAAVFLAAWKFVDRARSTGGVASLPVPVMGATTMAFSSELRVFQSPDAAQFDFEWRHGGMILPALVGLLLVIAAPVSWLVRGSLPNTMRLLMGTLTMPIVLAIPLGVAFSKPRFWSEDLAVPDFLSVHPLESGDWIAIKMKVAALASVTAWLPVLAFLALWLPFWADPRALHQIWRGWATTSIVLVAAIFLTWRLLVIRLWSGMSGNRRLYFASGLSAAFIPIVFALFDDDVRALSEDQQGLNLLFSIAAVAVAIKYAVAAGLWRRVGPSRVRRQVLLTWIGGTICFVTAGIWMYGSSAQVMLAALLIVPLARLLAAPLMLARNRHRW
ncbi:MAG TPA: hypothetical protein VKH42_17860 [Vicinamibacterales bacterium]|nr:hypothetical protein [Vicinamibacterales bacterium]